MQDPSPEADVEAFVAKCRRDDEAALLPCVAVLIAAGKPVDLVLRASQDLLVSRAEELRARLRIAQAFAATHQNPVAARLAMAYATAEGFAERLEADAEIGSGTDAQRVADARTSAKKLKQQLDAAGVDARTRETAASIEAAISGFAASIRERVSLPEHRPALKPRRIPSANLRCQPRRSSVAASRPRERRDGAARRSVRAGPDDDEGESDPADGDPPGPRCGRCWEPLAGPGRHCGWCIELFDLAPERCLCGCGADISHRGPRTKYATPACRKRAERQRSKVAAEQERAAPPTPGMRLFLDHDRAAAVDAGGARDLQARGSSLRRCTFHPGVLHLADGCPVCAQELDELMCSNGVSVHKAKREHHVRRWRGDRGEQPATSALVDRSVAMPEAVAA